jgi:hypothetical protein
MRVLDDHHNRHRVRDSYVGGRRHSWVEKCPRNANCQVAFRDIKNKGAEVEISQSGRKLMRRSMRRILISKEKEVDEEDGDWEERAESDHDEPLEYTSDLEADTSGDENDAEMEDIDDTKRTCAEANLEREAYRTFWIQAQITNDVPQPHAQPENPALAAWYRGKDVIERIDEVQDEMFPLSHGGRDNETGNGTDDSASDNSDISSYRMDEGYLDLHPNKYSDFEHIAGPGCRNRAGYSGHKISAEEMRGCQVSQCLIRKSWDFKPLDDDEDFEKEGGFCLSGLSDCMPPRDWSFPLYEPIRHGCKLPHAENVIWDDDIEEYAMPFHPWCFEVFKRTSIREHGTIDVDGLTSWWTEEARNERVFEDRTIDDVFQCREQEWNHRKGTEYLAANPLYVPKLRDIMQQATSTAPEFSPRNGAFTVTEGISVDSSNDLFVSLPAELLFEVLGYLRFKDIASLRMVSRAFRQLPISYFQKLLNRDMPWLWEARPTATTLKQLPYSFWATVTASEAERKLQKAQKEIECLNDYVEIVSEEMPELKSLFEEALPGEIQAVLDAQQLEIENDEDRKPFFLPPDRTNYYLLYVLIKRHWKELRGLRNRKRIWKDCEIIGKRIKRMRETGEIGPLVRQS